MGGSAPRNDVVRNIMPHTITTHLWYDKEAKEAAAFYASIIPHSKIKSVRTIHNTPSGDADIVSFDLAGQPFMAISAGPYFKFNPSISFHIKCKTVEEVDAIFGKLSEGGTVLMELGEYPFSKRYGWVQDKYGLSWQIIFAGDRPFNQVITPALTFVGAVAGKAEEAMKFYASVFSRAGEKEPKSTVLMRHGAGDAPEKEGTVKYGSFEIMGMEFGAMDSARDHKFAFNEAISFMVPCDTQEEIDYYWGKLSAVPESEQCGWLKDQFGVSWQITPTAMDAMMTSGDQAAVDRVTKAFLKMKKFDIAELERAAKG